MGRYFLACALLFIAGCSAPDPATVGTKEPQPVTPSPSVETGDGPPEKDLPKTLDLPLYPGAKLVRNKVAEGGDETRYRVTLETKDSPKKVAEFYKTDSMPTVISGDKAQAYGTTKKGYNVLIDATKKGDVTEIFIRVSVGNDHK